MKLALIRKIAFFLSFLVVLSGCEYRQTYGDITCTSSKQPISYLLLRLKVIPSKSQISGRVRFIARTDKYPIGFQALLTNRFGQSGGCGVSITPPENTIDITITEEWAQSPTTIGFYATTGTKVVMEIIDEHDVVLSSDSLVIAPGEKEIYLEWRLK